MLVFRLALRALLWRATASATVLTVAFVGIIAAAVGPIYLHAADASVLTQRLVDTRASVRDLHVTRTTLAGGDGFQWADDVIELAHDAARSQWFDRPVFSEEAQTTWTHRQTAKNARGGAIRIRYDGQLAAIDDLCRHVRVVAGRCIGTGATTDTVITQRSARQAQLKVGDVVRPAPQAGGPDQPLRIVGIVEPTDASGGYWSRFTLLNFALAEFDGQQPRLDSFFVSHAALTHWQAKFVQTISAVLPLRTRAVHPGDVAAVRSTIRRLQSDAGDRSRTGLAPVTVGSQLDHTLDLVGREMSLTRTLVLLPSVQLVLLAIFVLYSVVAAMSSVQGPEVALGKLRGRRQAGILAQAVLQPMVLVLLATPLAAVAAWLVVRAVAGRVLQTPTPVTFPLSALGFVAGAAGGAILAVLIAARRTLVTPVGDLLRRGTDSSARSIPLAIFDATAVTLALAALVQLLVGGVLDSGGTNPLSALAPTLLAVAAGVVFLRLLPLLGRILVRATRNSSRLALFLTVRQVVRRPAGGRVLLPVAVALALATFAVTNWSAARTNRSLRALNQAGASTVLRVAPGAGVGDLRPIVDRADPGGHSMAVAVVRASASTPLLAVDTARFRGVAAWRSSYSSTSQATILRTLGARSARSIDVTGTAIRLRVDLLEAPAAPVHLTLDVTDAQHFRQGYAVGTVRGRTATFTTRLDPPCRAGCRLTGLALDTGDVDVTDHANPDARPVIRAEVTAEVQNGSAWHPLAGFAEPARWRADDDTGGTLDVGAASGRLALTMQQQPGGTGWPGLVSADVPTHLPAVLASGTASSYPGPAAHDASALGLDARQLSLDGGSTAVTLPQLDRFGAMVDFGVALRAMTQPTANGVQYQVWLSPDAPSDMAGRLAALGVRVTSVVRAGTLQRALDHSGPAYAGTLYLVASIIATLLALGATLVADSVTARRRAFELAALEAVGVSRRVLRRNAVGEVAVVLLSALVVGVASGLLGSHLALPSTPFFVDEKVGPPAEHALPWGLVGLLVIGLTVVCLITCVGAARLVTRQATATRLREAQQ